ncbi:MAG: hypothetical protein IK147_01100 [Clostridia bacterium]|nr:hypothetical protein [Clostridia bacterium]
MNSVCDVNPIFKEPIYDYMTAVGNRIKAIKDINYTGTLNFETHVKTVEEIKETAVVGNTIFKGLM